MNKPYAESCDQNKAVIFSVISPLLSNCSSILEIGSGTGQHAVFFAENMPQLSWHTSDCLPYLDGINAWIQEAGLDNLVPPFELDVISSQWPDLDVDAIFTANTLHIMDEQAVESLLTGAGKLLQAGGHLIIYGPFNYNGSYTSDSNQSFDQWLKGRDAASGIKHQEEIVSLALKNGLRLRDDYEMPANNRILHFIKQ